MSTVISFKTPAETRREFIFQVRKTRIVTAEGRKLDFPCIVLCHRETGIPAAYPGFERWLFEMNKVEENESVTLKKRALHLCAFLNFILWNTQCDTIADISLGDIRNFLIDFKEVSDDVPRDPQEWTRGVTDVMRFLRGYVVYNSGTMEFKVTPEELITPVRLSRKDGKQIIIADQANRLYVRPPKRTRRKYRLLLHGHLDLLLYEAKKYDPMILPGIMLQAYAGLREGEVVNCTQSNIHRIYGGFGRISRVKIDLTHPAEFAESCTGKTEFGKIKVPRQQEVYTDFIESLISALDEHERYLRTYEYPQEDGSPLFYSKWRKPMTVTTYTGRVRKLFCGHFLPDLRRVCEAQGTWAENAPYIEAYEKEYPGAHMLRHWFTMYLLQYTTMSAEEVSHWRGDSSIDSMQSYIHVNQEFIRVFRDAVFALQGELLEEVP